jgi:hypothetical protein
MIENNKQLKITIIQKDRFGKAIDSFNMEKSIKDLEPNPGRYILAKAQLDSLWSIYSELLMEITVYKTKLKE